MNSNQPIDPVLRNVEKHISLNEAEQAFFLSQLTSKDLLKKEFLLKEGELCTTINYVKQGVLRAFYKDKDEKESTIMFAMDDWWITDMSCFVNQSATSIFIQAVENSSVLQLSRQHLEELYVKVPKFERFFRILMQNSYIREQTRVLQNLSLPAEERYHNFLKKYPVLARTITQKQIASYLGITPEFLSVIRKIK
jgi:CRP-like cAMP-binding protein